MQAMDPPKGFCDRFDHMMIEMKQDLIISVVDSVQAEIEAHAMHLWRLFTTELEKQICRIRHYPYNNSKMFRAQYDKMILDVNDSIILRVTNSVHNLFKTDTGLTSEQLWQMFITESNKQNVPQNNPFPIGSQNIKQEIEDEHIQQPILDSNNFQINEIGPQNQAFSNDSVIVTYDMPPNIAPLVENSSSTINLEPNEVNFPQSSIDNSSTLEPFVNNEQSSNASNEQNLPQSSIDNSSAREPKNQESSSTPNGEVSSLRRSTRDKRVISYATSTIKNKEAKTEANYILKKGNNNKSLVKVEKKIKKPSNKSTTNINEEPKFFKTLSLNCHIDGCALTLSSSTLLDDHLEKDHSVYRFRCYLSGCNRSFKQR